MPLTSVIRCQYRTRAGIVAGGWFDRRTEKNESRNRKRSTLAVSRFLRLSTFTESHRHAEQSAGFLVPWRMETVLVLPVITVGTRRHTRQGNQRAIAEGGANRAVFLADRVIELLTMQPPIFADRELDHRIHHTLGREALLAVDLDGGSGPSLIVLLHRVFCLRDQSGGIGGFDQRAMIRRRIDFRLEG